MGRSQSVLQLALNGLYCSPSMRLIRPLLLGLALAGPLAGQNPDLARLLDDARHPDLRWPNFSDVQQDLLKLYGRHQSSVVWLTNGRPSAAARGVIARLSIADTDGLVPGDYDAEWLEAESRALTASVATPSTERQARFDMGLSVSAARFTAALHRGRVNPRTLHLTFWIPRDTLDLPATLERLRQAPRPDPVFAELEPRFHHYWLLKQALHRYLALAASGLGPLPPFPPKLEPGQRYAGAGQLRRMLFTLGDLKELGLVAPEADTVYSAELAGALSQFQRRNGLTADSVVGPGTVRELQRPIAQRLRQIGYTLERWRWLPRSFSAPPIIVNIPAFRLHAFSTMDDDEASLLSMNVVVGAAYKSSTPVFAADMMYLVFRPYWEVTPDIMRDEVKPRALKDSTWLVRNEFELWRGNAVVPPSMQNIEKIGHGVRVRQKPGVRNALGTIKFMLPNEHNIYLHDSPSRDLFERARRDFSHGCIRLSDPVALAQFVLRERPEWSKERILAAMNADTPTIVTLNRRVPVFVVYGTTISRENGELYFYQDIYGHDRALAKLLAKGYPY